MQTALEQAIKEIQAGKVTCVVIQAGKIVHRASGRGVAPLRKLYEGKEGRALLAGATVADKVIGKAAAMILHLGGVGHVYGETMSEAAMGYMEQHGIPYSYGKKVPLIQNRTGDGTCPIEASVLAENDPEAGYVNIQKTIEKLMQGA